MTDRPPTAAPMLGTTVPADAGAPGYYPDPSVPGFVRYWAGHAWVPGTSRAAPALGEQLQPPRFVARYIGPPPYSVPPGLVPAAPAGPLIETGPIYLDETGAHTAFNMPAHPDPVEATPAAVEVRPRTSTAPLRPVEPAPWAVTGSGLQPAAAESWATATAAALRLGPVPVPEAAVVAPRRGGAGREAQERGRAPAGAPVRQVFAAGVDAEAEAEPGVRVPEPVVVEEVAPRPAQPLGGTPWHGAGGGGGLDGDGSVGMSAGPASLYEPRPAHERAAPEPLRGPSAGGESASASASASLDEVWAAEPAAGSGWRADPRAQRGLMDTGEAPRHVSWGVEGAPGEAPVAGSPPVERAAREPRAAHVTSERVRPPRVAQVEERPAERVRAGAGGARGEQRRPAVPVPVTAGLAARAFGWLVDGVVTVVVGAAVAVPMAATVLAHVRKKIEQAQLAAQSTGRQHQVWLLDQVVLGRLGVVLGVLALFALLYQVLPVARTGQTFGKRLARVRVVAAGSTRPPGFGRSLLRWLVGGLGTVLLLGLFTPLLDRPARRGWHDRAARTRVVRVGRR